MNALLAKIEDGHTDLVFELVAQGDVSKYLHDATRACAYFGDVSALKFLLMNGASIDSVGEYPLNTAAFHGHWRLCQFLIEQGIDVEDIVPKSAETALHGAFGATHGAAHEKVVRVLIANGADANAKTIPNVRTEAFSHACTKGETPLHRAAAFGSSAVIALLIKGGARVDEKDANGDTPLTWASWHRRGGEIDSLLGG